MEYKCNRHRCQNKPIYKVNLLLPEYMDSVQYYCFNHMQEGFRKNKNFIVTMMVDEKEDD